MAYSNVHLQIADQLASYVLPEVDPSQESRKELRRKTRRSKSRRGKTNPSSEDVSRAHQTSLARSGVNVGASSSQAKRTFKKHDVPKGYTHPTGEGTHAQFTSTPQMKSGQVTSGGHNGNTRTLNRDDGQISEQVNTKILKMPRFVNVKKVTKSPTYKIMQCQNAHSTVINNENSAPFHDMSTREHCFASLLPEEVATPVYCNGSASGKRRFSKSLKFREGHGCAVPYNEKKVSEREALSSKHRKSRANRNGIIERQSTLPTLDNSKGDCVTEAGEHLKRHVITLGKHRRQRAALRESGRCPRLTCPRDSVDFANSSESNTGDEPHGTETAENSHRRRGSRLSLRLDHGDHSSRGSRGNIDTCERVRHWKRMQKNSWTDRDGGTTKDSRTDRGGGVTKGSRTDRGGGATKDSRTDRGGGTTKGHKSSVVGQSVKTLISYSVLDGGERPRDVCENETGVSIDDDAACDTTHEDVPGVRHQNNGRHALFFTPLRNDVMISKFKRFLPQVHETLNLKKEGGVVHVLRAGDGDSNAFTDETEDQRSDAVSTPRPLIRNDQKNNADDDGTDCMGREYSNRDEVRRDMEENMTYYQHPTESGNFPTSGQTIQVTKKLAEEENVWKKNLLRGIYRNTRRSRTTSGLDFNESFLTLYRCDKSNSEDNPSRQYLCDKTNIEDNPSRQYTCDKLNTDDNPSRQYLCNKPNSDDNPSRQFLCDKPDDNPPVNSEQNLAQDKGNKSPCKMQDGDTPTNQSAPAMLEIDTGRGNKTPNLQQRVRGKIFKKWSECLAEHQIVEAEDKPNPSPGRSEGCCIKTPDAVGHQMRSETKSAGDRSETDVDTLQLSSSTKILNFSHVVVTNNSCNKLSYVDGKLSSAAKHSGSHKSRASHEDTGQSQERLSAAVISIHLTLKNRGDSRSNDATLAGDKEFPPLMRRGGAGEKLRGTRRGHGGAHEDLSQSDFTDEAKKHPEPADAGTLSAAAVLSGDLDLQMSRPLTCDPEAHRDLHHQLKSSLEVFQPRRWRPLTPDLIPQAAFTRCRPVSGRSQSQCHLLSATSNHRHSAHSDLPTSRPDSRVGSAKLLPKRPDTPRVNQGNFDTLSPAVLSPLVSDSRPLTPESAYGSVVSRRSRSSKSGSRARRHARSTGRSDSDSSSSGDEDSDDEWIKWLAGSDDESLSDMEKGNEPSLDPNRPVPDLHLRPELLDRESVPRRKSDMRRFDFSAENIDVPVYCFKNPVPSPLDKINIRYCALQKLDWKMSPFAIGANDVAVCSMMDRLVEIERIQAKTAKWETQRVRHVRRGKSVTTKARSKRCCAPCLQPACVGDCPHKRVHADCCVNCRQPLCTGSCTDTRYDRRMRQSKDEGDLSLTPINPSITRICKTCQGRNSAIAAQEIAQGRPRSAMTTFSRIQASTKGHTTRPTSAEGIPEGIPITVSKMKLEPRAQTHLCRPKKLRPHSRLGLLPGKSLSSNLNQSLTDLSANPNKTREPKKLRKSVS